MQMASAEDTLTVNSASLAMRSGSCFVSAGSIALMGPSPARQRAVRLELYVPGIALTTWILVQSKAMCEHCC